MGCSMSILERPNNGTEAAGLRSIKNKIAMVDNQSRRDREILTQNLSSDTAKLLVKPEKEDIYLGATMPSQQLQEHKVPKEYTNPMLLLDDDDDFGLKKPKLESEKTEITRGMEAKHGIKNTNNDHEDNFEGGRGRGGSISPDYDGPLWMSSPSFREYCVPEANSDHVSVKGIAVIIDKENANPDNKSNKEDVQNVTQDLDQIPMEENHIQHNDSKRQSVKRRNLRKVFTIRKPAAVRNLFNVATCYNPTKYST